MAEPHRHAEHHRSHRSQWLRAAVLGANDGLVSTASLLVGVAAAHASTRDVLVAGVAGLVAGAMSMAAGEYVSVSSQSDVERADLAIEKAALAQHPKDELHELAAIYEERGVSPETAMQVARELHDVDPLAAHAREELGITPRTAANPLQAAGASALAFFVGGVLPVIATVLAPAELRLVIIPASTLVFLGVLGVLGAWAAGAPPLRPIVREVLWGGMAMAVTAGVGSLFGVAP